MASKAASVLMVVLGIASMLCVFPTLSYEMEADNAELVVRVCDNLGPGGAWLTRGLIRVISVKAGAAVITHTRGEGDVGGRLQELSANNEFYKLRFTEVGPSDPLEVFSFVGSDLPPPPLSPDTIQLSLHLPHPSLPPRLLSAHSFLHPSVTFAPAPRYNTTLVLRTPSPAILPDTASFLQKVEHMNREKAENKDNRSFLAKYWMYILPVVILMVMSGGDAK